MKSQSNASQRCSLNLGKEWLNWQEHQQRGRKYKKNQLEPTITKNEKHARESTAYWKTQKNEE